MASSSSQQELKQPDGDASLLMMEKEDPNRGPQDEPLISPPPFGVDDRVIAPDTSGRLYEAVIRKAKCQDSAWSFLVHYLGWNSRWDRWIEADNLMAVTDEGLALMAAQDEPARKRKKQAAEDCSSGKKRKALAGVVGVAEYCELPVTLRTVLIEDCERVTRPSRGKVTRLLHKLPAAVPVRKVVSHYVKKKIQSLAEDDATAVEQIQAFGQGLLRLFDAALPVCLLYPEEIPQFQALTAPSSWAEVYGCDYLLRLFVRLPALPVDNPEIWGPLLADLLTLLQKNRQALFKTSDYRPPEPSEWMAKEQQQQHSAAKDHAQVVEMDTQQ